ncbi:HtaA domain-containing protein [Streptomyces sp. CA-250714]|uniref:HtaA domain-containing protein n=1 Tax=Streptomyces sp. CA-250714 TaxID=3240060 RepID=UPI003D8C56E9
MHSRTRHGHRVRRAHPSAGPVALVLSALTAAALTATAAPAAAATTAPKPQTALTAPGARTSPTAPTDERTVSGGRLDWGIKASFQSYVTGPIAQGRWSLTGGAATAGESQFRFHSAHGDYNPKTGTFDASFSGGVHFTGHRKPGGGNQLDLTVSRPAVHVSGRTGTLYADIRSKAKSTGKVTNSSRVPLASLDLGRVDMRGGTGPIALTNVPARLTTRGATAFAGYYKAGTPLDPVSLSVDLAPRSGDGSGADAKDKKKGEKDKKSRKADAGKRGRFTEAAVDWGVRRTFREYVTGSITKGRWKLTDGAQDGGALFRFPAGKGTYDREKGTLNADFDGAVRFTGKRLDLRLASLSVRIADGKGTLSADVTRNDRTIRQQPLITFPAAKNVLKPQDGLVRLSEVRSELTAQGAKAFDGMYAEGTRMDPVSLAVALDEDAELPALPDLGSGNTAAKSADSQSAQRDKSADAASDSSTAPLVTAGASAAVLLVAGGVFLAVRRKRARQQGAG